MLVTSQIQSFQDNTLPDHGYTMIRITRKPNRLGWFISLAMLIFANATFTVPAFGQLEKSSVAQVSSEVDLYIGGFRILDPWLEFWDSPALREFRDSAMSKEVEKEFQEAWRERRGNLSRVRTVFENRNTQDALLFLKDVISEDVFLVADGVLSDFLRRLSVVQRKSHLLSDPSISSAEKAELVYEWIDKLGPDWNLPTLILAGSITDKERALSKVDEVEGLLRFGLGMRPEARQALKSLVRVDDKRGTRLQWRIPFASIPWDAVPTNEIFDAESRDRLRDVLSEKSLVLTFGILDGRFVAALGGSTEPLPAVAVESSLLNHSDMNLVRDHQDQKITGIRYISDRLAQAIFDLSLQDFFSKLANAFIRPATYDLDDSEYREWLITCIDDAGWIDSTIEAMIPEPRGSTELSLLSDNRWEVLAHYRTVNTLFRGDTPLRGMKHWGNQPLLVLDVQLAEHPEYFKAARAIVQRIKQRLDDLKAIPRRELPIPQLGELPAIADRAWPILLQGTELWQNQALPNMNGEHAFILSSGGLISQQWHPNLPRSAVPLPIPEAALLIGIRDQHEWIQTLRGWGELTRSVIDAWGDSSPAIMAMLEPQRFERDNCITFGYPIPDDCPAPSAMMPRLDVESAWSLLSYSDSLSASIRIATEPTIGHGQFDAAKNLAKAAWIDLGGIAKMVTPWVRYGTEQSQGVIGDLWPVSIFAIDFTVDLSPEDIVDAWLALEKLGQMSSVTTINEDGSSYSRSIFVFED
jgi:hypothetical protein